MCLVDIDEQTAEEILGKVGLVQLLKRRRGPRYNWARSPNQQNVFMHVSLYVFSHTDVSESHKCFYLSDCFPVYLCYELRLPTLTLPRNELI